MFVRFTTSSNNAERHWGFQNALLATATANSGFTPSLPSGCIDYSVLSNDEAGGWVENVSESDLLTSSTDTAGTLCLQSRMTSKDIGIEEMSKHIKIQFDGSAGDFEQIAFGVVIPDGSTSANSNPLLFNATSEHNDRDFDHSLDWYVSITEEYCWIWDVNAGFQHIFGLCDLDGVPPAYKSQSNYWSPIAGLCSDVAANFHTSYMQMLLHPIMSSYNSGGLLGAGAWTQLQLVDTHPELYSTTPDCTYYNYSGAATPATDVYHKSVNTDGMYTDSLNPIAMFSPMNNIPYMPFKGIKALGRFSGASQDDVANAAVNYKSYINRIVYDENGDRYMVVHWNPWAPVAIRCV